MDRNRRSAISEAAHLIPLKGCDVYTLGDGVFVQMTAACAWGYYCCRSAA